jgi:hypothetical protein
VEKKSNDNAIHGSSRFDSAFGTMITIERRERVSENPFLALKKVVINGEKILFVGT